MAWLGLIAGCGDNARTVTRIAIDPGAPKVPAGIAIDLAATYVAADETTSVADDVIWQVADTGIAKVTPETGGHAKLLGVMTGTTMLNVSGTRGVAETFMVTVTPALLMTIAISPPQPSIAAGTSTGLIATGTYSDSSNMDLTTVVTWSSSADGVATVSDVGKLAGVAPGTATISASFEAVTGTADAAVTDAVLETIQVTPIDPSVPKGVPTQFTATGVFSDKSHQVITHDNGVVWSSDADAIASVDRASGLATLHLAGAATITATRDGISGSSHLTVTAAVLDSITITPPTPSAPVGLTLPLTATGTFSDGPQDLTTQVTWSSDHDDIASIDPDTGLVTAHVVGTAKITATSKAHPDISASVDFAVNAAVVVRIDVSPAEATIAARTRQQFTAIAVFSDSDTHTQDVTSQVTWTSNHPEVATILNPARGEALGVAAGDATITATTLPGTATGTGESVSGTATLHVTAAVLQSIAVTLPPDTTDHPSLANGRTGQFKAVGTFVDATDPANPTTTTQDLTSQVTWDSEQPTIAEISNVPGSEGQATARAEGDAKINATFVTDPGPPVQTVVGSATLTVTPAEVASLALDPPDVSVAAGHQQQFKAIATLTDKSTSDVTAEATWSSTNLDGDARVDDTGNATGVSTGDVEIGATIHRGSGDFSAKATLHVTAAVIESIEIEIDSITTVEIGARPKFTAKGRLSDGSSSPLTDGVMWTSDNTAIVAIEADTGVALAATAGDANITAQFGDFTAHVKVTVAADFLLSTVTPRDGSRAVHVTAPVVATFNVAIDPSTLTVQTESGDCTGALQLSSDNFASCVGFGADVPVMSAANTVATATPAAPLAVRTTYKVRVLTGVKSALGTVLPTPFAQLDGFMTFADPGIRAARR